MLYCECVDIFNYICTTVCVHMSCIYTLVHMSTIYLLEILQGRHLSNGLSQCVHRTSRDLAVV